MSIVNNGLISKLLQAMDNDISYIGIGNGSSPSSSDSILPGEIIRKPTLTYFDQNTIVKETYYDESEANDIQFTNAAAIISNSILPATGVIAVSGEIDAIKTNRQSLTVSIEITVEAVNI